MNWLNLKQQKNRLGAFWQFTTDASVLVSFCIRKCRMGWLLPGAGGLQIDMFLKPRLFIPWVRPGQHGNKSFESPSGCFSGRLGGKLRKPFFSKFSPVYLFPLLWPVWIRSSTHWIQKSASERDSVGESMRYHRRHKYFQQLWKN